MKLECGNHWHEVSPTGLLLVIQAFQQGDLHKMQSVSRSDTASNGTKLVVLSAFTVEAQCITGAFTKERVEDFLNRYHGHTIQVDGTTYERTGNGKA